jgi:hypothetical protein
MEINVLEVVNPPSKPVLAIHAGSVRRQAKLEVNQPFVIPHPGSQIGPVEVSLFQQLATHMLPGDSSSEAECKIPIKKLDGQASEVRLRIRRGEAATAGKAPKTEDSMGMTRDYLEHHQLQQRIQSLIQDVLREQPDNPYKYMVSQLRKTQSGIKQSGSANSAEEAKAMVPKPPDAPKPAGGGGRPAKQKQKQSVDYQSNPQKIEFEIVRPIRTPQGPDQMAARFSVQNVLRMPKCVAAAERSLRDAARVEWAQTSMGLIINSVKEKLVSDMAAPPRQSARDLARASLQYSMEGAAVLLSPDYHRAISAWARCVAYRGASTILGNERRASLPTPIVFLEGGGSSWGTWTSNGAVRKPSKTAESLAKSS